MNISQSLIKSLIDYQKEEECGLIFKAKYIDNRYDLFPPTDSQNVGAWFEFMATGSIPKNGKQPEPEYMARKKAGDGMPEYTQPYRIMREHVKNYNKIVESYGFEILRAGEDIKALYPDSVEKFGFEVWLTGTLDLRARATQDIYAPYGGDARYAKQNVLVAKKGQIVVIDLKVSGLLDDKWAKWGWALSDLHNKHSLVTQPIQYKFIELLNTGEEPPFLFFLFNMSNYNDVRIIDFKTDESVFNEHSAIIEQTVKIMHHLKTTNNFQPKPSMAKCGGCPLRADCKHKAEVAPITVYYFGSQT